MIRVSKRLKIIHDMVPKSVAADIGSDHGKLMIALVESKTIVKGYAVENKEGPFERLKNCLTKSGVINKVTPLFSDGLSHSSIPDWRIPMDRGAWLQSMGLQRGGHD